MPDVEPAALAESFERSAASFDDDPEFAALIVAELRRRADAGVRFWPGPQMVTAPAADVDMAELIDDHIPW